MTELKKTNEQLELSKEKGFDSKGGSVLGVLEGPIADSVHPTRNGRHYGPELWEKVFSNPIVKEQFKNGGIVGELDHPTDRDDICSEKIAVIMTEPPVKKDGQYYGKFNILNTPCGRIVYTLAKAGFKLGVSSRGTGEVIDTYEGEEVDPDSYDFTCFDVVLLPAVESARMNLITEGLNTKQKGDFKKELRESLEKSSDEDKKVMMDTLKDLNIDIEDKGEEKEKSEEPKAPETDESEPEPNEDKEATSEEGPGRSTVSEEELSEAEAEATKSMESLTDEQKEAINKWVELKVEFEKEKSSESCEPCDKQDSVDIRKPGDTESEDGSEEVGDAKADVSELLENLEDTIKTNLQLKKNIENLQKDRAVSSAKVKSLTEELERFKSITANAGKRLLVLKDVENEVESLTEKLNKANSCVKEHETKEKSLQEQLSKAEVSYKEQLKESISKTQRDSENRISEIKLRLDKSNKLLEQYKKLAHDVADRYIASKADSLGVSPNEIKNRLNESYTLNDVDNVCKELQQYSINVSRLPFAFDKPGTARVRMREDRSRDPLRNVNSRVDDEIDDYTAELANIYTGKK